MISGCHTTWHPFDLHVTRCARRTGDVSIFLGAHTCLNINMFKHVCIACKRTRRVGCVVCLLRGGCRFDSWLARGCVNSGVHICAHLLFKQMFKHLFKQTCAPVTGWSGVPRVLAPRNLSFAVFATNQQGCTGKNHLFSTF